MTTLPPASGQHQEEDRLTSNVRALAVVGGLFGLPGLLMCLPFNFGSRAAVGWRVRHTRTGAIGMWVLASTFVGLALWALLLTSFGAYRLRYPAFRAPDMVWGVIA